MDITITFQEIIDELLNEATLQYKQNLLDKSALIAKMKRMEKEIQELKKERTCELDE